MSSSTPPTIKECINCGKTIGQTTRGSLSSWLFRKAECNCGWRQKAKEPLSFAEPTIAPELVDGANSFIQYSQTSAPIQSGIESGSEASASSAPLEQTIAGRYEILEQLKHRNEKSRHSKRSILISIAVAIVSCAIVAALVSHLIKKNHAQWHEYDSQGKTSFNRGLYDDAEASFNKALSISTFAKRQQLESLQVLALLNHITGKTKKEAELNLQISDLKKSKPGNHLALLDRSSLRKVLNTLPQLSPPLRKNQVDLTAFWVLYSAYLLEKEGNQNEALFLIDESLPLLTDELGAKSRAILHLSKEKAQLMEQSARSGDNR